MQMLEKLKIVRRQLVRDIKRKEGGGKYTYGPDPKATKKDLDALDEYIVDLKKKISVEGYYGEGAEAEKALLESGSSLPFSKLVKDRYRSAEGGRIGFKSGKSVKDGIAALLKLGNKKFGKDTIKIADEVDRPESALLADEFAAFNERTAIPAMEGSFTKAEVVIERMENSLKNALGKTDADSKYVNETFPGMIKELKAKPELGNNPNVWKMFSEDMPKNQRLVVHSDDSVSFFQKTKRGPQNIKSAMKFAEENNISVKEASRILKMEPEDQILEITRLKATSPANVESALGAKQYGGLQNAQVPVEMMTVDIIKAKYPQIPDEMAEMIASLPNDKKALALADLEQAIMLQGTGRSSDEIVEIMKREPETKMKSGGLAQILEM